MKNISIRNNLCSVQGASFARIYLFYSRIIFIISMVLFLFHVDPPTVTTVPEDGFLEVKKGDYVDISCETTGTPQPIVNWRKNVSSHQYFESYFFLIFS